MNEKIKKLFLFFSLLTMFLTTLVINTMDLQNYIRHTPGEPAPYTFTIDYNRKIDDKTILYCTFPQTCISSTKFLIYERGYKNQFHETQFETRRKNGVSNELTQITIIKKVKRILNYETDKKLVDGLLESIHLPYDNKLIFQHSIKVNKYKLIETGCIDIPFVDEVVSQSVFYTIFTYLLYGQNNNLILCAKFKDYASAHKKNLDLNPNTIYLYNQNNQQHSLTIDTFYSIKKSFLDTIDNLVLLLLLVTFNNTPYLLIYDCTECTYNETIRANIKLIKQLNLKHVKLDDSKNLYLLSVYNGKCLFYDADNKQNITFDYYSAFVTHALNKITEGQIKKPVKGDKKIILLQDTSKRLANHNNSTDIDKTCIKKHYDNKLIFQHSIKVNKYKLIETGCIDIPFVDEVVNQSVFYTIFTYLLYGQNNNLILCAKFKDYASAHKKNLDLNPNTIYLYNQNNQQHSLTIDTFHSIKKSFLDTIDNLVLLLLLVTFNNTPYLLIYDCTECTYNETIRANIKLIKQINLKHVKLDDSKNLYLLSVYNGKCLLYDADNKQNIIFDYYSAFVTHALNKITEGQIKKPVKGDKKIILLQDTSKKLTNHNNSTDIDKTCIKKQPDSNYTKKKNLIYYMFFGGTGVALLCLLYYMAHIYHSCK